jgi:glycerol-3-phosphate cytidylyltransferase
MRGKSGSAVIGYTAGVFDMFHIGHLNLLRKAREQCDHLIVAVTTDELAANRKGRPPIVPLLERMEIVQSMRPVGDVVPQSSMDKVAAWHTFKFDRLFVGSDWRGSSLWDRFETEFSALGVDIVYFPYTEDTSSTKLRRSVFQE